MFEREREEGKTEEAGSIHMHILVSNTKFKEGKNILKNYIVLRTEFLEGVTT